MRRSIARLTFSPARVHGVPVRQVVQMPFHFALSVADPAYAHVPLVLGPDGERLAKRHGPVSLRDLREAGVTARRLVGRLAAMSPRDIAAAGAQIVGAASCS